MTYIKIDSVTARIETGERKKARKEKGMKKKEQSNNNNKAVRSRHLTTPKSSTIKTPKFLKLNVF